MGQCSDLNVSIHVRCLQLYVVYTPDWRWIFAEPLQVSRHHLKWEFHKKSIQVRNCWFTTQRNTFQLWLKFYKIGHLSNKQLTVLVQVSTIVFHDSNVLRRKLLRQFEERQFLSNNREHCETIISRSTKSVQVHDFFWDVARTYRIHTNAFWVFIVFLSHII